MTIILLASAIVFPGACTIKAEEKEPSAFVLPPSDEPVNSQASIKGIMEPEPQREPVTGANFGREFKVIERVEVDPEPIRRNSQYESYQADSLDLGRYDRPSARIDLVVKSGFTTFINDVIGFISALMAIYLCLFGFRIFGFLMLIFGFFVSYYSILLGLNQLGVTDLDGPSIQLSLFFGAIILGLLITFLCYMFSSYYYIIFGISCATMVSMSFIQYAFDMSSNGSKLAIWGVFGATFVLAALMSYFFFDHVMIWASVLVGSTQAPINIGILSRDMEPFYARQVFVPMTWAAMYPYAMLFAVMMSFGLITQYYLRRRIIERMRFSDAEEPEDYPKMSRASDAKVNLENIL